MTYREKKKLGLGLVMYITSLFNAAFYLFCDYGLYCVLSLIAEHFSAISESPGRYVTRYNGLCMPKLIEYFVRSF